MKWKERVVQSVTKITYHWTFLFIWVAWGLYQWFHFSYLGSIVFVLITLRLWTLPLIFRKVWLFVALIFIFLGGVDTYFEKQVPTSIAPSVEGVLRISPFDLTIDEASIKGEGILYLSNQSPLNVRFYFTTDDSQALLQDVYYLQVKGTIEKPAAARNFYVFDYRNYLKNKRIYWQVTVDEVEIIESLTSWKDFWDRLKIRLLGPLLTTKDNLWTGWMKKLLFNLNSSYYTRFQEDLSYLGIMHFFAISGFHIQYFSKRLRYLLLRIGVNVEMTRWLIPSLLIIYGWLIGWPVGALRAIGGLVLEVICGRNLEKFSSKDRLGIVGLFILMWDIRLVTSLGFLLSFLMTYLILFYQQQLKERTKPIPSWFSTLEMTVMCLFFSWPILLYQYFEWHPYQLIMIVLIASLFEWVWMPLMVLTSVIYRIAPEFVLIQTTKVSMDLESYWSQSLIFLRSYFTPFIIGRQSGIYYISLFLLAALWLYLLKYSRKRAYQIYLLCLSIWIFCLPHLRWTTRLTILDIGQGDSLLYQPAGTNEHWLIDTGGRLNWNKISQPNLNEPKVSLNHQQKVLLPALKALGVHCLTGVIVTHSDIDHMGNLYQLDQTIPIQQVIFPYHANQDGFFNEVLQTLKPKTTLTSLNNGERYSMDSLHIFQLHYPSNYMALEDNDASLLTYIKIGPYGFLNMGDLSTTYEPLLIEQYSKLTVTGLKLGHHGSRTSTSQELLSHYKPQTAYISAGVNNQYNHPHQEVIQLLQQQAIPYASTPQQGAIQWRYSFFKGLEVKYALTKES